MGLSTAGDFTALIPLAATVPAETGSGLALQGGAPILIAIAGHLAVPRIHDVHAHPESIEDMVEAEGSQPTAPARGEMP